uniref:NADH-ubiquinone oxidoreductase chain 5 n=1 Tax=Piesma cf. maculatum TaxID=2931304 RepID=A0A8T9ZXH7_9HEMI|nr:NADH dehydrogenase subunit 5 [Piesma cf. maculatum]
MNNKLNLYNYWSFIILLIGLISFIFGLNLHLLQLIYFLDWEIISLNSASLVMTLLLDSMSLLFIGSVMFISSMVIYYSTSYMSHDENSVRFLFLVLLFILSMFLMIMSPNMVSILLGWDGLGLVSYCLVIYFNNYKSYNAGLLTILSNRIGDVAILMSIFFLFDNGGWHFMFYSFYNYFYSYILILLVVLASFTKSAQIPFSSWLPAAMAAPTPVSALVHSSTLVTAGVYLLIRFSNLILQFDLSFFLLISVLTMFMAGLGANFEYDLKKIIALSTLSQLGLMMSILFLGFPLLAFFHLLTHAFFKALLFLCAGLIIHCMNDTQDIRFMGFISKSLPFTSICFCISNLSLCGLPFLSGFYSKDLILECMTMNHYNLFIFLLFYLSISFTLFYSMRLINYLIFNYSSLMSLCSYNEDLNMNYSMIFLLFLSIVMGNFLSWIIIPSPLLIVIPFIYKILPILVILISSLLSYFIINLHYFSFIFGLNQLFLVWFFGNMWFMPYFSTYMIYSNSLLISSSYNKVLDGGWGEYLISLGLFNYFIKISNLSLYYQKNNIKLYFISFILFSFILLLI